MEVIGIIVGLLVLMILAYKGFSVFYVAPIAAIVVALTNSMPLLETFTKTFMTGAAGYFTNYFPIFLLGTMLGQVYSNSNAGVAIAHGIMRFISKFVKS